MFRVFSENLKLLFSKRMLLWMLETTYVIRFGMWRQEWRRSVDFYSFVDNCMLSIRI